MLAIQAFMDPLIREMRINVISDSVLPKGLERLKYEQVVELFNLHWLTRYVLVLILLALAPVTSGLALLAAVYFILNN